MGWGGWRGLSCVLCNSYVVWSGILILLVDKTRIESQRSRSVSQLHSNGTQEISGGRLMSSRVQGTQQQSPARALTTSKGR